MTAQTFEETIQQLTLMVDAEARALFEDVAEHHEKTMDEVEVAFEQAKAEQASAQVALRPSTTSHKAGQVHRTEFGNMLRMVKRYGENLMYVPGLSWFVWTGNHWRAAQDVDIAQLAKETVNALIEEVRSATTQEERNAMFKFYLDSQKAKMVNSMLSLIKSEPGILVDSGELDKQPHLLGVGNGVVDLRTGELLPPNRDYRITIITEVHYNPEAKAPLFEQTVSEAFFDDEQQVKAFQRLAGYILTGEPVEQIIAIPYGDGANSKSTVIGALRVTQGRHARTAAAETFVADRRGVVSSGSSPREDLVRLRGARMIYVTEPGENSELREPLVKGMSGGEPITARGMYSRTSIEILPTFTVVMPTNHRPIIKGVDEGIWRRIHLIPFTRNFEKDETIKRDKHRLLKLINETEGILAWMVRGVAEYRKHGLNPTESAKEAVTKYRNDMDLLGDWIAECCITGGACADSSINLWTSWFEYAKERGELGFIPSSRSLGRRLANRGFRSIRDELGVTGRGFAGIKVVGFGVTRAAARSEAEKAEAAALAAINTAAAK